MVVVFSITEINHTMLNLFGSAFFVLYLWRFFDCAICLVSGITTKVAMAFPSLFTIF